MNSVFLIYILLVLGFIIWFYIHREKEKRQLSDFYRVKDDISMIITILEKYYSYYKHYPSKLYEVLVGLETPCGEPYYRYVAKHNPDMINFAESLIGRRTVNGEIVDPWDNPYNIYIDTDNDGIVEIDLHYLRDKDGPLIEHYHVQVGASIAIWSNGPNKKDDLGLGDDIKSW